MSNDWNAGLLARSKTGSSDLASLGTTAINSTFWRSGLPLRAPVGQDQPSWDRSYKHSDYLLSSLLDTLLQGVKPGDAADFHDDRNILASSANLAIRSQTKDNERSNRCRTDSDTHMF